MLTDHEWFLKCDKRYCTMDHSVASGGFAGLWMPKGPIATSASLPFFRAALRARLASAFAFLSISRFRFSNVF
jgi:hypothetical protein